EAEARRVVGASASAPYCAGPDPVGMRVASASAPCGAGPDPVGMRVARARGVIRAPGPRLPGTLDTALRGSSYRRGTERLRSAGVSIGPAPPTSPTPPENAGSAAIRVGAAAGPVSLPTGDALRRSLTRGNPRVGNVLAGRRRARPSIRSRASS